MSTISNNQNLIDRLFAAGSHFGFKKSRRHPSVKPYLFGNKLGNDVFDLEKSATLLEEAKEVVGRYAKEGKAVLFVGTKEEAALLVKETAEKLEAPFVTNRWVGGMITNWSEVQKRLNRLFELIAQGESGELERKYTKKERVMINRELAKLTYNFGGIRTLSRIPDLLVVVDPRHDILAINEAKQKNIPVVGIMSSDNNAKDVNYPVVVNDTLRTSISLALNEIASAYEAGKKEFTPAANNTLRRPKSN
ncbi:MAG: 30S ribosomal protein S2 [Candidatus Paceibacterota bacterium]